MKKLFSLMLIFCMVLTFSACGGDSGEALKEGNPEITITDAGSAGYSLYVSPNTFGKDAVVTAEAASDPSKLDLPEKFELLGDVVELGSEEYDGKFFGTDVTLTVPLPESAKTDEELERYFMVTYDESTGEPVYLEPDYIDTSAGTMTVTLPHFSFWAPVKLTPKEEIALFLNSYSAKQAVAELGHDQAADQMGPYVQAKIDALGLTEEAAKQLKQSVLKELGGMAFDDAGELGAAAYNSIENDDPSAFEEEVQGKITEALNEMLDQIGKTKATKIFTSIDKTSKITGYLAGGDTESAMKELGSLMADAIPLGDVTMKAVGYVEAKVNESMVNWKANEVEELYQIYKNGLNDFWQNEVTPGDWESMSEYLNYSNGFTKAKAVNRFYNLDKVGEVCKKYGWSYSTYEELPEDKKAEFNKRAEEGLKRYFEQRLAQEKVAEKIKEQEEVCIEDMLRPGGALASGYFNEFFGETSKDDYSLTDRLNRLVNVRAYISRFVDEKALAESAEVGSFNYGDLLNKWVSLYSENMNDRDTVIKEFIKYLQENKLLNTAWQPKPAVSVKGFLGKWKSDHDGYTYKIKLVKSGKNIVEQELNLPWRKPDIMCTEYSTEFDEDTMTLKLSGITCWVADADGSNRRLDLDATGTYMEFTAVEVGKDGKVTVMTNGVNTYTR